MFTELRRGAYTGRCIYGEVPYSILSEMYILFDRSTGSVYRSVYGSSETYVNIGGTFARFASRASFITASIADLSV